MEIRITLTGHLLLVPKTEGVYVLMPRCASDMHRHYPKIGHTKLPDQDLTGCQLDLRKLRASVPVRELPDGIVPTGTLVGARLDDNQWNPDQTPNDTVQARILLPWPVRFTDEDRTDWEIRWNGQKRRVPGTHRITFVYDMMDGDGPDWMLKPLSDLVGTGTAMEKPKEENGAINVSIQSLPANVNIPDLGRNQEAEHYRGYFCVFNPPVANPPRIHLNQDPKFIPPRKEGVELTEKELGEILTASAYTCMIGRYP
jgi:hypothetical protein